MRSGEIREIQGFPDYRVSSDGEVFTRKKPGRYRPGNFCDWRPMIPGRYFATKGSKPYLSVTLSHNGKRTHRKVHRLVLETFVSPRPDGMECRHLNGDASDNRVDNLVWGTPKENARDTRRHGRHNPVRGELNRSAKLTHDSVLDLRNAYVSGEHLSSLSKRFGISKASAVKAAKGETWSHVPMPSGCRPRSRRERLKESEKSRARDWRAAGVTIKEIGHRLGISASSVSRFLGGVVRRQSSCIR